MIPQVLFRFDDKTLHRAIYPGPQEFISETPVWAGEEVVLEVSPNCGIQVRAEGYDLDPQDGSFVRCPVYVAGSRRNDVRGGGWSGWDGQSKSSSVGFLKVYGGKGGVRMVYSDGNQNWTSYFTTSMQCLPTKSETEEVIFANVYGKTLLYLYDQGGQHVRTRVFDRCGTALAFVRTELSQSSQYPAARVFDCTDGWEMRLGPTPATEVVDLNFTQLGSPAGWGGPALELPGCPAN